MKQRPRSTALGPVSRPDAPFASCDTLDTKARCQIGHLKKFRRGVAVVK